MRTAHMDIQIHDEDLQARLNRMMQSTGAASVEEVLARLLETQEEQDRWLADLHSLNEAKIRRGIRELQLGKGIPDDQLDSYLKKLKSAR